MWDFSGHATPAAPRETKDQVNTGGTIIGDIFSFLGGAAQANKATPGAVGGLAGAGGIGNILLGGSEIADGKYMAGAGDIAAGGMGIFNAVAPNLFSKVPWLGAVAGGAQLVGHGAEAYKNRDQIDQGYQDNTFWTEAGNATLGGASAAASFCPPAAAYLGLGQLALDGAGALSGLIGGEDYRFSAGSVVGGLEHMGYDALHTTANHASHSAGGGIGATLGGVAGSILGPVGSIAGAAAGSWLGDTVSSWF